MITSAALARWPSSPFLLPLFSFPAFFASCFCGKVLWVSAVGSLPARFPSPAMRFANI
ncbi:hypothetical protein BVRB_5g114220 [Beta vulgaris subsp. vulgaris]|nr:hypothetical protein BVRB_5g114220 [Beta vulgaris subsp. vulgaris]